MKKLCALLQRKFFSQHDDTKIISFNEGVLIPWPFFWSNVIFKICHFCLKSHNWRTENSLASPGKLSDLALKTKTAWIKRSISLHNFAALQSGEATQINSSLPQLWLLIQKKQILKMTLPHKNGSRIKMPSSESLILVSFCWKKNFLLINALTNLI